MVLVYGVHLREKPDVKINEQLIKLKGRIESLQNSNPDVDLRSLRDELKKEWEERDLRGERGVYEKFAAEERRNRGEKR